MTTLKVEELPLRRFQIGIFLFPYAMVIHFIKIFYLEKIVKRILKIFKANKFKNRTNIFMGFQI